MDSLGLNRAGKSLEDAFFDKENRRLLEQLREKAKQEERRKALREVIQIHDEGLVDRLLELGVGPETVIAVTLVPLAMVAWADGSIEPAEREAILRAAAEKGVKAGTVSGQMLESWLTKPIAPDVVDAWKHYLKTILPSLTPHDRDEIRNIGLERARQVAEAAGGFLGFSRISPAERAVLDDLGQVLAE
jgi:hypothetical protein